jgi:hypothetical protein
MLFGHKNLEIFFNEQHHEYVLSHNHTSSILVGKLRIKCRECFKVGSVIQLFFKQLFFKLTLTITCEPQ